MPITLYFLADACAFSSAGIFSLTVDSEKKEQLQWNSGEGRGEEVGGIALREIKFIWAEVQLHRKMK